MRKKWILFGVFVFLLCALIPLTARADDVITVFADGAVIRMDREAYLAGVVAAEMPASYEMEALKAQAVAARTRTMHACQSHPETDVCTDSTCCQGYLTEEEQKARWGMDTEQYRARVREAVDATRGIIITYSDEPIEVLYHAVSGGYTEDAEQVFHEALPYLRGVISPGEENAPGYETVRVFTQDELAMAFSEKPPVVIEVLRRSDSGRVTEIRVGAHTMSGRLFRSALELKSTNFTLQNLGDSIIVTQHGYGHGVGMSQAGANAMAKAGKTFNEILLHYYTGVDLSILVE
ncbi:MAG: stage II sporulation protein D [Firmicutes bacterium]|nr:stage II sporulation protein D [Bacillota bacterium]